MILSYPFGVARLRLSGGQVHKGVRAKTMNDQMQNKIEKNAKQNRTLTFSMSFPSELQLVSSKLVSSKLALVRTTNLFSKAFRMCSFFLTACWSLKRNTCDFSAQRKGGADRTTRTTSWQEKSVAPISGVLCLVDAIMPLPPNLL
jgi:hypothetical protein